MLLLIYLHTISAGRILINMAYQSIIFIITGEGCQVSGNFLVNDFYLSGGFTSILSEIIRKLHVFF